MQLFLVRKSDIYKLYLRIITFRNYLFYRGGGAQRGSWPPHFEVSISLTMTAHIL